MGSIRALRSHLGSSCSAPSFLSVAMSSLRDRVYEGDEYVISELNLIGFLIWAKHVATEDEIDQVIEVLTYTVHERPFVANEPELSLDFEREDLDRIWNVRIVYCQEPNCRFCNGGGSPFHFRWIGPWTCRTFVGNERIPMGAMWALAEACPCPFHMR